MLTQLSCLVFGYIRHKGKDQTTVVATENEMNSVTSNNEDQKNNIIANGTSNSEFTYPSGTDQESVKTMNNKTRPAYLSYFDPIVENYYRFHSTREWLEHKSKLEKRKEARQKRKSTQKSVTTS